MSERVRQEALDWLRGQWRMPTRLSTVPQAMKAIGISETDPLRWDVASVLSRRWRQWLIEDRRAQWGEGSERLTEFQSQLRTWQFPSLVLTVQERLVGRALLAAGSSAPAPIDSIAAQLGIARREVELAFDGLTRVGILDLHGGDYQLAAGYRRLTGGLGLSFHYVTVEDENDTFNTTCAIDYIVLAKGVYAGKRLRLYDACAQSLETFDVEYDSNGLSSAQSTEPLLYRGGTCATNLLFRSEADLRVWLKGKPPTGKAALLSEWIADWGKR